MPVRMTDIARDLGLSIITVSKVLRNCPDISAKTRARVLRLCQELHYCPNLAARSLITGRTNMMGLVIADLGHTFFTEIAWDVWNNSQDHGHLLSTNPIKISPTPQPPNFIGSRNDLALRSSIVLS